MQILHGHITCIDVLKSFMDTYDASMCWNLTWAYTMYRCAEIFNAMFELTGNVNKTCEQQHELETVRITKDMKDL